MPAVDVRHSSARIARRWSSTQRSSRQNASGMSPRGRSPAVRTTVERPDLCRTRRARCARAGAARSRTAAAPRTASPPYPRPVSRGSPIEMPTPALPLMRSTPIRPHVPTARPSARRQMTKNHSSRPCRSSIPSNQRSSPACENGARMPRFRAVRSSPNHRTKRARRPVRPVGGRWRHAR